MPILNPFIYGKPVSGNQHINREQEIRFIFSRLINGECTAIVGEPRMGKTSLLRRLASESSQKQWLAQLADGIIVVEVDFYQEWLSTNKAPKDFWKFVLDSVKLTILDETILAQIKVVEEDEYGSSKLAYFFQSLGRKNLRVVLMIDEFDAILTHPNFNTTEFLGGLRSLAMREGFQLITASIMPVEEMNLRSESSNSSSGSPFFNHFIEINLKPFSYKDVGVLIDSALNGNGVEFDSVDRNFIVWISGRHPYRVQVACAALFDSIKKGLQGKKRYIQATEWFSERTNDHFATMWRRYLSEPDRTVLVILSLVELGGMIHNQKFSFGEIEKPQFFTPELKRLEKMGLVEKVGNGWQWDKEHLLLWQGERWRISSGGFVDWLANYVISDSRGIPSFKEWLHNKEKIGNILTRNQIDFLEEVKNKVPKNIVNGVTFLAEKFISEIILSKK